MDPISILPSSTGLVKAAGKIASLLYEFTTKVKDAPNLARHVMDEVSSIRAIISSLQVYLVDETRATKSRESMILVEHLIVTLTGCVCSFDELESELVGLKADSELGMKLADKAKWVWREQAISKIFGRLQNHKSSLGLILIILESKSTWKAEKSLKKLCTLVEQLVESQENLSKKLQRLETQPALLGLNRNWDTQSVYTLDSNPRSSRQSFRSARSRTFSFDSEVEDSGVYSRVLHRGIGSSAKSTCSQLSLAEISKISILNLPIFSHEILNRQWYSFEKGSRPRSIVAPETKAAIAGGFGEEAPAAPISAAVTSYDFENGRFRYTLDVLMIDGKHWRFRKYFEDFYDFQISLLESFSSHTGFVGKQWILLWTPRPMPNVTEAVAGARRKFLDNYVKQLLTMPPHIRESVLVRKFFAPKSQYGVDVTGLMAIDGNQPALPSIEGDGIGQAF